MNIGQRRKHNNKGFSLVELIVVVLIMAIIAVALAPQVMKWIDQSRIANDLQMKDRIVELMQVTATSQDVIDEMATMGGARIEVDNDGLTFKQKADGTGGTCGTGTKIFEVFTGYAGTTDLTTLRTKKSNSQIYVTISDNATIVSAQYFDKDSSEEIVFEE